MEEETEKLTEFQRAVFAYREAGFGDYMAVCDFLDVRDEILNGVEIARGRFKIYPYLRELNEKQKEELYDSVLEKFAERVECRLRR